MNSCPTCYGTIRNRPGNVSPEGTRVQLCADAWHSAPTAFDAALAALDVEHYVTDEGWRSNILGLDAVRAAHRAEVERAVAEEREACAKAARGAALVNYGTVREFDAVSQQREACSDAVRARGGEVVSVIINAKIESTMLGVEDHGILSCMLHLSWQGAGQGFGGYAFDEPVFGPGGREQGDFKGRRGCAFGAEFIRRLLDVLRVERWERLPGTYVRLRKTDEFGAIEAIGHITDDRWFDPKVLAAEFYPKRAALEDRS